MSKYKNAYLELADLFDELNAHYNALVKKQTETKPLVRRKIPSAPVESAVSNKLIEDLKAKAKEANADLLKAESKNLVLEPLTELYKAESKPLLTENPLKKLSKVKPKEAYVIPKRLKTGIYKPFEKPSELPKLLKKFFDELTEDEIIGRTPKQLREVFKERTGIALKGETTKLFKKYLKIYV